MWTFIKIIFQRPLLASGLVGAGIHSLMELNEYYFYNQSHFLHIKDHISRMPVYGLLQLLIPFIIPFLVTLIGRKIQLETKIQSLMRFPQANSDLVIKLGESSEVLFVNTAMEILLRVIKSDITKTDDFLPPNTDAIIKEIIGTDKTVIRELRIGNQTFEFRYSTFNTEDAVFLSGRDITRRIELENNIKDSHNHLIEINEFADNIFRQFDPLDFDEIGHYLEILNLLLQDDEEDHSDKPTHIFLTFRQPDNRLQGHIYTKHSGKVIRDEALIKIDPLNQDVAIMKGSSNVTWSNWDETEMTLETYQRYFHEDVRSNVGIIKHFITYQSQDVALIAFYRDIQLTELDAQVLKGFTVYTQSLKLLSDQAKNMEDAFIYTIEALARAAEANDNDTGDHIVRVNAYSKVLAEQLGMAAEFVQVIHYSAQMHDVGKIHINPNILKKPGKLVEVEFEQMMIHTEKGASILGTASRLEMAREIALSHHEKYDGSGYPFGLKGDEIPIAARIVSISDVYDALRQKRSYKPSYSHKKAFEIITQGDGRIMPEHFDPQILEAFKQVEDQFRKIFDSSQSENPL